MRTGPLLIAQLDAPHASREGDWYYRTFAPGRAMAGEDGVYVINLDNVHRRKAEVLRAADVLVLNSVVDPDLLPLIAERRRRGQLTVYELSDDISAVPPWNPVHYFFRNEDNVRLFRHLVHSCDACQYSVEELRRLYGHLNPRGQVFPNQLLSPPPLRPEAPLGELVIGWGGSRGHLEDMAAIAAPLMGWLDRRPEARLHLMCGGAIWQLFDRLPAGRKQRTLPGSIEDYYTFLRSLDIGIAPLQPTAFNRSRSDVKFVEYAAHGVAAVLQRLVPYESSAAHLRTALLFDDDVGLIEALDLLRDDGALRQALTRAALREVGAGRLQVQHATKRLSFYRELLGPGEVGAAQPFFAGLLAWEGVEADGRHALLGGTRYERLLHDGLVLSQQEGRRAEGALLFREAAALAPEDHYPHLCLAAAGQDPVGALGEALRRSPRSLQCLLLLGMHQAARGETGLAIERLLQAAALAPDYELPLRRLSQVLSTTGQDRDAERFARRAEALMQPLM